MRGHAVSRYAVSCTMMSRRRPRVSRRKAARRSTRDGWFHPVCDISWSNPLMRCCPSSTSLSMAVHYAASVASSTRRGSRGSLGRGGGSVEVEEAIAVPAIKQRRCALVDLAVGKPPRVGEPLQRRSSMRGPGERIAVDEQAALIVEQPGAAVQADTATRGAAHEAAGAGATARRREDDAGLGLGEVRAEKSRDRALVPG